MTKHKHNLQVLTTNDGSKTLYLPQIDETYHSRKGALAESRHVFIKNGLAAFCEQQLQPKSIVKVLEVGFGTGLNALLAWQYAEKYRQQINYCTLEPFPLSAQTIAMLDYDSRLPDYLQQLTQLHDTDWEEKQPLSRWFNLYKTRSGFLNFKADQAFDVVFYDAFAPEKQPELWEQNSWQHLYKLMATGGYMTTYCVKGAVRRGLQAAGFEIKKLPGPPAGKREMCRAIKQINFNQ